MYKYKCVYINMCVYTYTCSAKKGKRRGKEKESEKKRKKASERVCVHPSVCTLNMHMYV